MKKLILITIVVFSNVVQAQLITNLTTNNVLPHNNVSCAAEDSKGNLWFGTQNGLVKFDGTTWFVIDKASNQELLNNSITAIEVDNNDKIWVGTNFGISVLDDSTFTNYTTNNSNIGSNRIRDIYKDSNQNIWVAESNGISTTNGVMFEIIDNSTHQNFPFGGINSVSEDNNGDMWFGSAIFGALHYSLSDSSFQIYSENEGLLNDIIKSIAIDHNNDKWVGTASGITILNDTNAFKTNHTKFFYLPPPDTLNPVEDIAIAANGDIWVGVYVDYLVTEGGVAVLSDTTWVNYDVANGLVSPVVHSIFIDSKDNKWVTTNGGISVFSQDSISTDTVVKAPLPAAIAESVKSNEFSVYPNPASDLITVKSSNITSQNVNIYDINSKLRLSVEGRSRSTQVNIAQLETGIYFIQKGKHLTKLLVK